MIALIILAGAFLRLFRISINATFLGEQGRDLIIAKNILQGKLTLLGPPTSISNVHFGPFYHYFNAFFLYIFKLDPVGPAVGFGLISILSIYLLYQTGKNLKNKTAGLIAATLFAFSPLMTEYGQTMFNSHLITGFTIFSIWAVSLYFKNKNLFWLMLSGFFTGISFQANFLSFGIFLGLTSLLFFEKIRFKKMIFSFLGFLIGISPYLIFELRHQFFNLKAFLFLLKEGKAIAGSIFSFPVKFFSNYFGSVNFLIKPASFCFSGL